LPSFSSSSSALKLMPSISLSAFLVGGRVIARLLRHENGGKVVGRLG
jgi:hypothetical protein